MRTTTTKVRRTTASTLLETLAATADDARLLDALRDAVREVEGLDWEIVTSPRRFRSLVDARRRAEAVYRTLAEDKTWEHCAAIFRRDHSTLMFGAIQHEACLFADSNYAARYRRLTKAVVDRLKYSTLYNNNTQNQTLMFTATISGNLGRAAEVKNINGKDYYKLNLAASGSRKDAAPTWVSVLYYKSGDKLAEYLVAGAALLVQGRLEVKAYKDKNGDARTDVTLWADTLEITKYADRDASAPAGAPANDDLPDGDGDIF